jgi:uncharacterized protein YidB (DUF937 family)
VGFLEALGLKTDTGTRDSILGGIGGLLGENSPVGGLSGVLEQLSAHGLGPVGDSWVAKGRNLPISAEQIQDALGSDQVAAIAKRAGVSPDEAAAWVSKLLPGVVDSLTPDGRVPEGR